MNLSRPLRHGALRTLLLAAVVVLAATQNTQGQVTPNEISNPGLKALEESHFQQLIGINQAIARMKFPFSFYLSRYVGLDPAQQAEADSRGLEFVRFQDRNIVKISGNYNAAYNALKMTQNERATNTFRSVVLPILGLVTSVLPPDIDCDGIGFEVSHHARTNEKSYNFEGKEILVVVFRRDDAWAMARALTDGERQMILNRNQVFVSGADFGLSLSEPDPLNVQSLTRSIPLHPDATSTARSSAFASHSSLLNPAAAPFPDPTLTPEQPATARVSRPSTNLTASTTEADPKRTMKQKDADYLDDRYETQLAALAKEGAEKYHFVSYAPPSFVIFHDQIALQLTMKNTLVFGPSKSSIYKRAAQSFDLFLAPQMKNILERISGDVGFQLYDFSLLNKLSPAAREASEAIEYICPREAVQKFVNAEITNQQLLDQSVVLVNGVRIALNLQLVE